MNAAVVRSVGGLLNSVFPLRTRRRVATVEVAGLDMRWEEKTGRAFPPEPDPRGPAEHREFRLHLTLTLRNTADRPRRITGLRVACPASALLLLYGLPWVPGTGEPAAPPQIGPIGAGQGVVVGAATLPHPREDPVFDLRVDVADAVPAHAVARVPVVLELPAFAIRRDYGPYPLYVLQLELELGRGMLPLGTVLAAPAGPMLDGALEKDAESVLRAETRRALAQESPGDGVVEFASSLNRRLFDWVAQRRRTVETTLAELSEFGPFHVVWDQPLTGRAEQLDQYVEGIDKRQAELRTRLFDRRP
ncbi:hypothetical protein GCM10010472_35720 [Pseudonocardia halophobica]|uniref:Uncharacterized protein n=1 Tax=Pseudonocardia halophobica TaxID=29401 RepID=A0A9W6L231_9PSEU|nr:hypothetical protein [Pseudonocardia halophobica]GLL12211.1 hypothetical protein GCM10017577_33520 [Pseudonocardia halophobica]